MALEFPVDKESYLGELRFTPVDKDGGALGDPIILYLPASLQLGDKVEFDNMNLGGILQTAMDMFDENTNVKDALKSAGFTGLAEAAMKNVVMKASDVAGGAVRQATRKTPNPNTRAIFKQVNLRSFQFTFKLIPNNDTEADNIIEIIKEFRKNMYPERTAGNFSYMFPTMFRIEAFYDGFALNELGYNIKSRPSYLESVMSNYNPSSQAFVKSANGGWNYFSEIDLSLTFIEGEPLDRVSVEAGF